MLPQLRLMLFGKFQATLDEQPLNGFVSAKAQALLAYLAMSEQARPRDELAALLWGDMPDADAQTNLRKALSNLKQLLGPYLLIDRQQAGLNPNSPTWVDAAAFRQEALSLLPRGKAAPGIADEATLARWQACTNAYTGKLLSWFQVRATAEFDDWLLLQRERLHSLAEQLLHHLAAQLAARRRYTEALQASARLLELAPWNEDVHRQHILLLACDGQRSAALRQYAICRQTLQTELGAEPGAETQALYQRLLQGRPPLAYPGDTLASEVYRLPFAGREAEHAWLVQRWNAARRWQGGLTLVAGESGIGKTRLVRQVLEQVALQGGVILAGRCYEFNRAQPHQAIHDAVQNYLASLAPGARPNLTDDLLLDMERMLFTARQTWPGGITLFLDDLQWADADTLDLLHFLVRRLAHGPCWLVGAYRPEETPSDHPLHRLIGNLENNGLVSSISLHPLPQEVVTHLTNAIFHGRHPNRLAEILFAESQGNPFLINELVALLQENVDLQKPAGGMEELRLPDLLSERVKMVIRQRVERLDETSQYLLTLAAAFGQPFSQMLLQTAGDCPEATVTCSIASWIERRLVRQEGDALDFTHDKIRSTLVQSIPATLRRLVHARLGAALEIIHQGQDAPLDLLVHHYDLAQNWSKALHYLKLAGDHAAQVHAFEQARSYYQRGLEILRQQLSPDEIRAGQETEFLTRLDSLTEIQGRRARQISAKAISPKLS